MSHTPPISLSYGKNTSAFLTLGNPEKLVVFIHGFNGTASGTWGDFPELIRSNNHFANSDVIFYGYDSLKGQANISASLFYDFLNQVLENSPNDLSFERHNINDNLRYSKVLIVAHSLGAIVTRRALLNANIDGKQWLSICQMVLFAPAHLGALIPSLLLECLQGISQLVVAFGFLKIPVLNDLKIGSPTIEALIKDTNNCLSQNIGEFTIANKVVWAEKENIVHCGDFCEDPRAQVILNQSHISICKPNQKYLEPYKIVLDALI